MALPAARLQHLPILLECARSGESVADDELEKFGRKVLSDFAPGSLSSPDISRTAKHTTGDGPTNLRYLEVLEKALGQLVSRRLLSTGRGAKSWTLTQNGRDYLEDWFSQQLPGTTPIEVALESDRRLWELVPNWLSRQPGSITPELSRAERRLQIQGEALSGARHLLLKRQRQAEPEQQPQPAKSLELILSADSLGLGAVAWPHLTGQQRKKALAIGDQVTLQEAADYLLGAVGHHELVRSFGTERRKRDLQKALDSFGIAANKWAAGELRDPKLNWLVPDFLLDSRYRLPAAWLDLVGDPWRLRLKGCQGAHKWLPFLSMEAAIVLRTMSLADHALISTALGKASLLLGSEGVLKPWRAKFRTELGMIPVGYIFQAEANSRLGLILGRLLDAGCHNIGHLVILDRQAWQLARDVPTADWGKLKLTLEVLA